MSILQRFSERINNPEVLTNPQEFLGLHYKKVLEFWERIEKLTQDQLKIVKERYWSFRNRSFRNENYSEHCSLSPTVLRNKETSVFYRKAIALAWDASDGVVGLGYAYEASWAAEDVTKSDAARWATREILGNVENPVFLKMFDNL
jgi:hypothetical protein